MTKTEQGETLAEFAAKMRSWATKVGQQLNDREADVKALTDEANEIRHFYRNVPYEVKDLEKERLTLQRELSTLVEQYELIEAQYTLEAEGKNAEQRKANLTVSLLSDTNAVDLKRQIDTLDMDIKIISVEIAEKEKLWSDYHRRIVMLAAKAQVRI